MKRESDTTINTQNDKDIPETNYQEFKKVIDSRRSVRVFKEDPVPDDVIKKALNDGFKAPNSSNLQPWKFIWVKSENKRERLSKLCFSQRGAKTAQHLIICVAQTNTWKKNCKKILEVMKSSDKKVPNIVENYYKKIAPASYGFIGPFGVLSPFKWLLITMIGFFREIPRTPIWPSDLVTWAVKSTALACENIILSLRAQGYDSLPMEGFDSKRVKTQFSLGKNDHIVMIIGVGKRASNGIYGPQVRFPKDDFIFKV